MKCLMTRIIWIGRHYEERKRVEDYDHSRCQKLISLDTFKQRNPGNFPSFCRLVGSQIAHNVRCWHLADMPSCTAHVRYWG